MLGGNEFNVIKVIVIILEKKKYKDLCILYMCTRRECLVNDGIIVSFIALLSFTIRPFEIIKHFRFQY